MGNYEDVYMMCPFCRRVVLKSATDEEIGKWMDFHIRDRGCMSED